MLTQLCPRREKLAAFHAGKLTPAALEEIAHHLDLCGPCSSAMESLDGDADPLVLDLRKSVSAECTLDPNVARVIHLVESLGPDQSGAAGSDLEMPTQLGQYQLLEKLGEGGMGRVFKAHHKLMDRVVALKVLQPKRLRNPEAVARFHREVRALAQLDHPHIVRADYADQEGDVHYLVMEFVDGINLDRLVHLQGPLPASEACALIQQAARGLQHAFENGLVHRDIKPSNLMLTPAGTVKVLDLGLAHWREDPAVDEPTAVGQLIGTLDYMAPEQGENPHAADIRADIYSLGCTLYYLLAGKAPFHGAEFDSVLKKLKAHATAPVPPLRDIRLELPLPLVMVVERMLAKDPAERFATPAEVVAALEPFAGQANLKELSTIAFVGEAKNQASTVSEGPLTGKSKTSRSRRRLLGWVAALAASMLIMVGLAWNLGWLGGANPQDPIPPNDLNGDKEKAEKPPAGPLRIETFKITHYRGDPPEQRGTLGVLSNTVRFEDDVRVHIEFSEPAYCYLIAFNPDGTEQACVPKSLQEKPARATKLDYPEATTFILSDGVGLQAFVLVASREKLPPYEEWQTLHGKAPWQKAQGKEMWRFNGDRFAPLSLERGKERDVKGPPQALQDLCAFFQQRSVGMALQVIAFPVKPKE